MKRATRVWSVMIGARQRRRRKFARKDDLLLQKITARHFPDGYSILQSDGGWFDRETGRFIREESRQIIVCSSAQRRVVAWAKALGLALSQKELMVMEHGRSFTVAAPV